MPSIADFYVELHSEGTEKVKKELTATQAAMKGLEGVGKALVKSIDESIGKSKTMVQAFKDVGSGIAKSFTAASAAIAGLATAGFTGTVQGERLAWQFRQLSMEIASIFLPVMEKVTLWVGRVVAYFRSLTTEQQDSYMRWGMLVVGITAATKALSMFGLLQPIVALGFKALAAAMTVFVAHPIVAGIIAIAAAIGVMVVAMGKAVGMTEKLAQQMQRMKKEGFTDKEVENSRVAALTKNPLFEKMTKEQKAEFLKKEEEQAKDRLATAEGFAKDKDEFKRNVREGKTGEKPAMKALADIEIAQKLQEQLKATGKVDVDQLKPNNARRQVTPVAGGFEGLSATYSRIQEGIMKTFDPSIAHKEVKDQNERQIALAEENNRILRNIKVGAA